MLGSGGHSTEMIRIIEKLPRECTPTGFFIGSDDQTLITGQKDPSSLNCHRITLPRPRHVGQSLITTPITCLWTTIVCFFKVLWMMIFAKQSVDVLLCNGPAICLIVALVLKLLLRSKLKIIYIESFARTKRLSMTGWLIRPLCSNFFVQWPKLIEICKRPWFEWVGILPKVEYGLFV